jgi:mRNA-degrading endonuclease toxin of MazEF toxin-antitoxin module
MRRVEQGEVRFRTVRRRGGRRWGLSLTKERPCVVVSAPAFHHAPGSACAWVVPAAEPGSGEFAVERLEHVALDDLGDTLGVLNGFERADLVNFLLWAVGGRTPLPDAPPDHRRRHQAAIDAGGRPAPGDVVRHEGRPFVVVSGVAFNADDALDVVWGVPLTPDGSVHADRVTSLPKSRLPRPAAEFTELDALRARIRWILTGATETPA